MEKNIVKTKEKLIEALEANPLMIDEMKEEPALMIINDEIRELIEQIRFQQKI